MELFSVLTKLKKAIVAECATYRAEIVQILMSRVPFSQAIFLN